MASICRGDARVARRTSPRRDESPKSFARPLKETTSLEPASAYKAVTRQIVFGVADQLREIKSRLHGLLVMVAASLLLDVALRLANGG